MFIAHHHTLDQVPIRKFKQILFCPVQSGRLNFFLDHADEVARFGQFLPETLRKICHLRKTLHAFFMQPGKDLTGPVCRLSHFADQLF